MSSKNNSVSEALNRIERIYAGKLEAVNQTEAVAAILHRLYAGAITHHLTAEKTVNSYKEILDNGKFFGILNSVVMPKVAEKVMGIKTEWPAPFASPHEAQSVIAEEVHEFNLEVWKKESLRSKAKMIDEAYDIVGAAIRFIVEMNDEYGK